MARTFILMILLIAWSLTACTPASRQSPGHVSAAGLSPVETLRQSGVKERGKSFDSPAEAAEFFVWQRAPFGQSLPVERYLVAQRHIREVLKARRASGQRGGVPRGPRDGGGGGILGWKGIGPGHIGGRTRAIVIHPINPNIMYIGGVTGGVWKTTDGGASWTPLTDFLPNIGIGCIAMDPADLETLYVGTGEGYYPYTSATTEDLFLRGSGVFKTTDGGASFAQLPGTSIQAFEFVNDLIVSPENSQHVFAATWKGLYRSLDAGQSWTRVLRGSTSNVVGCTELEVRTDTSPPTLLAGFGSFQPDGIYRSVNNGNNWSKLTSGLPTTTQGRITLAIAPSDQNVMYACIAQNFNGAEGVGALQGVYRSTDGGNSWTQRVNMALPTGVHLLSNQIVCRCDVGYDCYYQGWYDNAIVVDAANPDIVFVGGVDLQRSDDGGVTWGLVSAWWQYSYNGEPEGPNYCHADVHRLVLHPDYDGAGNQMLFVGSDGGVFRSDNARAATTTDACNWIPPAQVTFVSLNAGYDTIQFYHGDAEGASGLLMGGAQDNGSFAAGVGEPAQPWARIYGGDGGYCAINYANPDIRYAEIQYFPSFRKSIDGGQTFVVANNGITGDTGLFIAPLAMDPVDPDTLWTGGTRPWRTKNGAGLWKEVGAEFSPGEFVSAIAVAPSDNRVVYVGLSDGYLYRTMNGLAANPIWSNISAGLRGGSGYMSWIAVDPTDADIAYVTYSTFGGGKVFRTATGGAEWADITGAGATGIPDIPVDCVTMNPRKRDVLYAGTDLGVFISEDGGATWAPDDLGLPHTIVETLDWLGDSRLAAFTHGRSVFLTDVCVTSACDVNCDGSVNPFDIQPLIELLGASPPAVCAPCAGDADGNGTVNPFDINAFLECLDA